MYKKKCKHIFCVILAALVISIIFIANTASARERVKDTTITYDPVMGFSCSVDPLDPKPNFNIALDVLTRNISFAGQLFSMFTGVEVGSNEAISDAKSTIERALDGDFEMELLPSCLPTIVPFIVFLGSAFPPNPVTVAAAGVLVGVSAIYFNVAKPASQNVQLCGYDWQVWALESLVNTDTKAGASLTLKVKKKLSQTERGYFKEHAPIKGSYKGSYSYYISMCINDYNFCPKTIKDKITANGNLSLNDKIYREYIYQGEEFMYDKCKDPREEVTKYDIYTSKYSRGENNKELNESDLPGQTYYFRGSDSPNFACDRYSSCLGRYFSKNGEDLCAKALKCCIEASKEVGCITRVRPRPRPTTTNTDPSPDGFIESNTSYKMFRTPVADIKGNYVEIPELDIPGIDNVYVDLLSGAVETIINLGADVIQSAINSIADGLKSHLHSFWFGGISYQSYVSKYDDQKICVKSYSVCPYNFTIGQGTEEIEYFWERYITKDVVGEAKYVGDCIANKDDFGLENDPDAGVEGASFPCRRKPKNFCQVNRHCFYRGYWSHIESEPIAPFFDKACINMVGSTHSFPKYSNYQGYSRIKEYRGFAAPMVECVSESIKNLLFNKAGHTRCENIGVYPDINDVCEDGAYLYRKGDDLSEANIKMESFIVKLQNTIRGITKLFLIMAISLYGFNVLRKGEGFDKKSLMNMLVKICIVAAFSTGTWWYEQAFTLAFSLSNYLSEMTLTVGEAASNDNDKFDGCYFSKTNIVNEIDTKYETYGSRTYVSMFDTLDCKIKKYFAYSPEYIIPNIIGIIGASFLIPYYGAFLFASTLFLFFALLFMTMKAVYFFVSISLLLAVLFAVGPLMIPLVLFERTKGIFESWYKNIIGVTFQSLFLFVGISAALILIDNYATGSAVYTGEAPMRTVYCSEYCLLKDGRADRSITKNAECRIAGGTLKTPKQDSVLCYLHSKQKPNGILASFGISLYVVDLIYPKEIFLNMIILILVVYVCEELFNVLPGIGKRIVGGVGPSGLNLPSAMGATVKAFKVVHKASLAGKDMTKKAASALRGGGKGGGKDGNASRGGAPQGGAGKGAAGGNVALAAKGKASNGTSAGGDSAGKKPAAGGDSAGKKPAAGGDSAGKKPTSSGGTDSSTKKS